MQLLLKPISSIDHFKSSSKTPMNEMIQYYDQTLPKTQIKTRKLQQLESVSENHSKSDSSLDTSIRDCDMGLSDVSEKEEKEEEKHIVKKESRK